MRLLVDGAHTLLKQRIGARKRLRYTDLDTDATMYDYCAHVLREI